MKKYLQKVRCVYNRLKNQMLFLLICFAITGCSRQPIAYNNVDTAMGTIISQTIYVLPGQEAADADNPVTQEILSCIGALERDCLSWRLESAEVGALNKSAGTGQAQELSLKLMQILEQCKTVYAASDGAFDFTLGSVVRLWDIDNWTIQQSVELAEEKAEYKVPENEEIAPVIVCAGAEKLIQEGNQIILPQGMQLDFGAVGKGIALDEIKEILLEHEEVTGAAISVGGSILTYGSKPDGNRWNVAVVDPFDTAKSLGVLQLSGQWCVSTSGDYERFVEVDGVRYHHILDPSTGYPADSGVKSVTILSENGLLSDALSTACFVMGVQEGMQLAESFQAEALFVDEQGEIYMTEGMKEVFHLSNSGK